MTNEPSLARSRRGLQPPGRHPHDAEILRLAIPAFGALLAEPLFLLADSAIVGHLGTEQLAGLGIAGAVLQTALSLCTFLAYGSTAAVSRRLGAGDQPGAVRQGIDAMWVGAALGLVLTLLGLAASKVVVGWFGADAAASHQALVYLRISVLGVPAALAVLSTTGLLRGLQDTRTPLYVAVAANVANVALNYTLVYGAHMGVAGSATGTVLAQWASAGAYVAVVLLKARGFGVSVAPHLDGMRRSLTASLPLVLRNLALRSVVTLSAVIATQMGSADVAAHQVAFNLYNTLALGLDAIAIAGQALVGRYLGASDTAGARQASRRMIEWSVAMGALLAVLVLATRHLLPTLFTRDEHVRHLLAGALIALAVMQPAAGWVFALDGILIGAGDARYVGAAQLLTVLAFLPLGGAVLVFHLGLQALWWALVVWVLSRLAVMGLRYRTNAWLS